MPRTVPVALALAFAFTAFVHPINVVVVDEPTLLAIYATSCGEILADESRLRRNTRLLIINRTLVLRTIAHLLIINRTLEQLLASA